MPFPVILVHVDKTQEGRRRLTNAVQLAVDWNARLIGVGAAAYDPLPDRSGMTARHLREWIDEDLGAAETLFREATAELEDTAWRTRVQRPVTALADLAAGADILVASRRGDIDSPEVFARPDDLVLAAGAPVLVQPPRGGPLLARKVVIGWKNTRESRRAVSDALPLLRAAEAVNVLRFDAAMDGTDDGLADVLARLRRHGVAASGGLRPRDGRPVAEQLIAATSELGANLIVAGAYGQPRLRELVLGGVTRGLLAHSPHPVLFSH